jgi:hypothetical protein
MTNYEYREDFVIGDPVVAEEWDVILASITNGQAIKASAFRDAVITSGTLNFSQLATDTPKDVLNTKRMDSLLLSVKTLTLVSPVNNFSLPASLAPSGNVMDLSENSAPDQSGCPLVQVEPIYNISAVIGSFVETAFGTPANCGILIEKDTNRVVTVATPLGRQSVFVSVELRVSGTADGTRPFNDAGNGCRLYFFYIDASGIAQATTVPAGTYQFFYGQRYGFGHMPSTLIRDTITTILDMPSPTDINLQNAYDNGSGVILTDATRGAVAFQRGSAGDTDNVFEIMSGMGIVNLAIAGNGNLTGKNARFDKADLNYIQLDILATPPSYDPLKPALWYEESGTLGDGQLMLWDGVRIRIVA